MAKVVLFSKPGCVKCKFTKQYLDKHNIEYDYLDVSTDGAAFDRVKDFYGFSALPVVAVSAEKVDLEKFTTGEKPTVSRFDNEFVFTDFRINILEEIKNQLRALAPS